MTANEGETSASGNFSAGKLAEPNRATARLGANIQKASTIFGPTLHDVDAGTLSLRFWGVQTGSVVLDPEHRIALLQIDAEIDASGPRMHLPKMEHGSSWNFERWDAKKLRAPKCGGNLKLLGVLQMELALDVVTMAFDRLYADSKGLGDLLGFHSFADEAKDFELTGGEISRVDQPFRTGATYFCRAWA